MGLTALQQKKLVTMGALSVYHEALKKTVTENIVSKTWSELKAMRDGSTLKAGQWYRITDFVTTTAQAETQSGGHAFDIIVRADAANTLNEHAFAARHSGDTYFANSKLEAWELMYCIDNDSNRFAWAQTSGGKGVIWHMKDEYGNECGYDFKNIMFARYQITACAKVPGLVNTYNGFADIQSTSTKYPSGATISNTKVYRYTFDRLSGTTSSDATVYQGGQSAVKCYGNKIARWYVENQKKLQLNNITFGDSSYENCYNNELEENCRNMAFGRNCYNNHVGGNGYCNTIGNNFGNNTIGNNFVSNTIGESFYRNTIGNSVYGNSIGNNFGDNTIGNDVCYNSIGNYFEGNSIGHYFQNNSIGNDMCYNSIGEYFRNNSIGNNFQYNSIGNYFWYNSIGNSFWYNSIGNSVQKCHMGCSGSDDSEEGVNIPDGLRMAHLIDNEMGYNDESGDNDDTIFTGYLTLCSPFDTTVNVNVYIENAGSEEASYNQTVTLKAGIPQTFSCNCNILDEEQDCVTFGWEFDYMIGDKQITLSTSYEWQN